MVQPTEPVAVRPGRKQLGCWKFKALITFIHHYGREQSKKETKKYNNYKYSLNH